MGGQSAVLEREQGRRVCLLRGVEGWQPLSMFATDPGAPRQPQTPAFHTVHAPTSIAFLPPTVAKTSDVVILIVGKVEW